MSDSLDKTNAGYKQGGRRAINAQIPLLPAGTEQLESFGATGKPAADAADYDQCSGGHSRL